jgi:hypothetical protein
MRKSNGTYVAEKLVEVDVVGHGSRGDGEWEAAVMDRRGRGTHVLRGAMLDVRWKWEDTDTLPA